MILIKLGLVLLFVGVFLLLLTRSSRTSRSIPPRTPPRILGVYSIRFVAEDYAGPANGAPWAKLIPEAGRTQDEFYQDLVTATGGEARIRELRWHGYRARFEAMLTTGEAALARTEDPEQLRELVEWLTAVKQDAWAPTRPLLVVERCPSTPEEEAEVQADV